MTLDQAISRLAKYVGPVDSVTDQEVVDALNELRERFFESGKWKGLVVEVEVTPADGIVELPDTCESILGAQFDGRPVVVFSRYHEFLPGGPGEVTAGGAAGARGLLDQGDRTYKIMGAPDVVSVRLTCKLRYTDLVVPGDTTVTTGNIVVAGAGGLGNANGTYTVAGTSNGKPFYVKNTNSVYSIRWGISGAEAVDKWRIYENTPVPISEICAYKSASAVATPDLATSWVAEGGDSPVPTVTAETTTTTVADSEVIPGNLGALKAGLMSLSFESNGDAERADIYFNRALALLNGEVKEARGAAQAVLQTSPHGFSTGRYFRRRVN